MILVALDAHPAYRLIVAANRDEFYARPTAPAAFWHDAPQLLAGRDLQQGGTWLGITHTGRFAAITNYREPRRYSRHAPSRGELVTRFLLASAPPGEYGEFLRHTGNAYNGFNLIFGHPGELCYFSNRGGTALPLSPGIHGLSNHLLDTPWPKVTRGKDALAQILARETFDPEELFSLLADPTPAPDRLLPDTGVGIERERLLSPLFIRTSGYGTRSSTVILVSRGNGVTFMERNFNGARHSRRTRTFRFVITPKRGTIADG